MDAGANRRTSELDGESGNIGLAYCATKLKIFEMALQIIELTWIEKLALTDLEPLILLADVVRSVIYKPEIDEREEKI